MTGFGKGEAQIAGGAVTVEVRTVNHRYLDCTIRLPRTLASFEIEIERIVRKKMRRGHIYITVSLDRSIESGAVAVNGRFLARVYRDLSRIAAKEKIPGTIDINTLLSVPDLLTTESDPRLGSRLWTAVRSALMEALRKCSEMRGVEGAELVQDITRRLAGLEKIAGKIEKRAPVALRKTLERSKRRLQQLIEGTVIGDDRWAVEAAILADRTDFSEELVRLKSHLSQLGALLDKGGEISKKLTFLLQEVHREATTMGNKAADTKIINHCLSIKSTVEKMREQVQNLE
jgi:uncharacterized protein (TIGR00255 family)